MNTIKQRKHLFVLLVLLALFAACKGESPTAPTSTSPGGGVTPPVGSSVTLTVSQAEPLTTSSSVITATVTTNGQPVANGTAVEFTTDFGTFTETGTQSALRTTTNGVATVTLASPTPGKATIQAVVNNVSKTTSVTFKNQVTPPCIPNVNCPKPVPTITSISPAAGNPGGGEPVTITGTNFTAPVKVFFDFGAGTTPKEVFIVSATDTQIIVTTPPVDLGTGQTKNATIFVLTEVGTANQQRATAPAPFVYQAEVLTPSITTLSPASGPIEGGTSVTIYGDAFQAPVQVFFGSAEAQVTKIEFKQITVISPTARDTNPNGSGTVTGPVTVKVINILSNKSATLAEGFRYTQKMQITSLSPVIGTSLGGTEVRIDGVGFNDPLTVDFLISTPPLVVRAQVLRVSGTEVIARTGALPSPCSGGVATVTVTNVDNGDSASSVPPQAFTFVGVSPVISSIVVNSPPATVGSSLNVTVNNPGVGLLGTANTAFTIGGLLASSSPTTIGSGTGAQPFSVVIPSVTFPTVACTVGTSAGTMQTAASFPIVFTNTTTECSASSTIVINPPSAACVASPSAAVNPPSGTCADAGTATAAGNVTSTTSFTISNTGGGTLQVGVPTKSGTNPGDFTIAPSTAQNITAGNTVTYNVTFDPGAVGPRSATVTFTTNDPAHPTVSVCLTGAGT